MPLDLTDHKTQSKVKKGKLNENYCKVESRKQTDNKEQLVLIIGTFSLYIRYEHKPSFQLFSFFKFHATSIFYFTLNTFVCNEKEHVVFGETRSRRITA